MTVDTFASNWWTLVLRGAAAIAFGLLTFFRPGISLLALIVAFGAYALADGILNVIHAIQRGRDGSRWGSLLLGGLAGIGVGLVTLFWPKLTALALLLVIAAWAIINGVTELVAAVRLRKVIRHEWVLGAAGLLSVAFGLLVALFPGTGALAVILWIGAYAIVYGGLLVGLGLRVRSWDRTERRPTGRAPVPV